MKTLFLNFLQLGYIVRVWGCSPDADDTLLFQYSENLIYYNYSKVTQ